MFVCDNGEAFTMVITTIDDLGEFYLYKFKVFQYQTSSHTTIYSVKLNYLRRLWENSE
jgi:hypothetical protein